MGWSIGFDSRWNRDIVYGVPAWCDLPTCHEEIDRGLAYVCGGDPYGGEYGCGLFFCEEHLVYHKPRGAEDSVQLCPRCVRRRAPYKNIAPDHPEWIEHKLTDDSWAPWRAEHPGEVAAMKIALEALRAHA